MYTYVYIYYYYGCWRLRPDVIVQVVGSSHVAGLAVDKEKLSSLMTKDEIEAREKAIEQVYSKDALEQMKEAEKDSAFINYPVEQSMAVLLKNRGYSVLCAPVFDRDGARTQEVLLPKNIF